MPLLEILIINVIPIISRTETEHKIARSNLKIPPISSSNFTILSSAIGWITLDAMLYIIDKVPNFIIGIIQIPTIATTPTTPTAFLRTSPHPKIVSTESPNIFPTTGIKLDTAAFAALAVIPRNHTMLDFIKHASLLICILSDIFETMINAIIIDTAGNIKETIIFPINSIINNIIGCITPLVVILPV